METKNTDKILKDFFGEHKHEIADKGFTQGVMRQLPEQADYSWVVWAFTAIAISLTLFLGFRTGLFQHLFNSLLNLPIYYILGGIFCFPLLSGIGLMLSKKQCCQLV